MNNRKHPARNIDRNEHDDIIIVPKEYLFFKVSYNYYMVIWEQRILMTLNVT